MVVITEILRRSFRSVESAINSAIAGTGRPFVSSPNSKLIRKAML